MFKLKKKSPVKNALFPMELKDMSASKVYDSMQEKMKNAMSYHDLLGLTTFIISNKPVSHCIADEADHLKWLNKTIKRTKNLDFATRVAISSLYCFNDGEVRYSKFGKLMHGRILSETEEAKFEYNLKVEQGKTIEDGLIHDSATIVCSHAYRSHSTVTTHLDYKEMEDGGYEVTTRKTEEFKPAVIIGKNPWVYTTELDERIKKYDENGIQYEYILITGRDQVKTMLDGTKIWDCGPFTNIREEEHRTRLLNPAFVVGKNVRINTVTGEEEEPSFSISTINEESPDMPWGGTYYGIDEEDYNTILEDHDNASLKFKEIMEMQKHYVCVNCGNPCLIEESL